MSGACSTKSVFSQYFRQHSFSLVASPYLCRLIQLRRRPSSGHFLLLVSGNTPLPSSTPTDPHSAQWVASIQRQISTYYGHVALNTWQFSAPVYTAPAGAATTAIKFLNCQNKTWVDPNFLTQVSAVPIPSNAVASSGTDQEMIVWQPSTDQVWELWEAEHHADGWYACWGGRIQNASQSKGVFDGHYGVAATSLSLLGGLVKVDEVRQGHIDHAISMSLVEARKLVYSWPAQRSDGSIDDPNAIAEGQRFRLDPTLNVDTMNISSYAKLVAHAMQTYGVVVSDKSGAVALYGEGPQSFQAVGQPDPWPGIYGGQLESHVMDGFPWSRMQALPFDYGKNGVQQPGTPTTSYANASGYRAVTASGSVTSFGDVLALGSAPASTSIVSMSATPTRNGYWVAGSNGAVYPFGDAVSFGSMQGQHLNAPIVGMASRPSGNGYYVLGRDGGVFSFGDAPFYGSTGNMKLNAPVVGMTVSPTSDGYWFVAADGGIFAYGSGAGFYGSMGAQHLNKPIVGMAATPTGRGYWLVASDGGVFAFGDAPFYGSTGNITLNKPIVGMSPTQSGAGYRFIASDGGIFSYGDADFRGSLADQGISSPVVALCN